MTTQPDLGSARFVTVLRASAAVRIAHVSQIHTFVTDTALPPALQEICRSRGVKVIEALPGAEDEAEELGAS